MIGQLFWSLGLIGLSLWTLSPHSSGADSVIVVVGAGGEPEFETEFSQWAESWRQLATARGWSWTQIGPHADDALSGKEQLHSALRKADPNFPTWLVLVGHGTYGRGVAKFNLTGPDVSASELDDWLSELRQRVVLLNCSSASAPFLTQLSKPGRIIVSATRSGSETNYARFGGYLAEAIQDQDHDIDHDQEVSLLEAFLAASSLTERFYRDEARLATEHALIDDNGDGAGTPADFYRGIRPAKRAQDGRTIDGAAAKRIILRHSAGSVEFSTELAENRLTLERSLDLLRQERSAMSEDAYLDRLEELMLEMAGLYDAAEEEAAERIHRAENDG